MISLYSLLNPQRRSLIVAPPQGEITSVCKNKLWNSLGPIINNDLIACRRRHRLIDEEEEEDDDRRWLHEVQASTKQHLWWTENNRSMNEWMTGCYFELEPLLTGCLAVGWLLAFCCNCKNRVTIKNTTAAAVGRLDSLKCLYIGFVVMPICAFQLKQ